MIFSTPIFVFAFLPMFLAIYYTAPTRARSLVILLGSCVFYGWWKAEYLILVLAIAGLSYVAGHVAVTAERASARKWAVRLGVTANLAILGWFKYTYFLTSSYNDALAKLTGTQSQGISLPEIILPIGLSFLVFQSISYILDVARKDAPPARNMLDFLAFSTLFPQLIAGPILRYKDLADQFQSRTHSLDLFTRGVCRFVTGLAMKLVIADSVAPLADRLFLLPNPTMAESWLAALAYSIQLFFDFAGYSAMAIGLGLMIGFRFVENFNAPYTSRSITEFWQRWHISLSNWLRDYLYVPLGGNRGGAFKTYRNLILTMVLGGLWHGANWTFVVWGLWHGSWMALERALGIKGRGTVWPSMIAWPMTMVLVMIGWVMFRATSIGQAFNIYVGMSGANGFALSPETLMLMRTTELLLLVVGCLIVTLPMLPRVRILPQVSFSGGAATLQGVLVPSLLFGLCWVLMMARTDSPFLYFQF